MFFFSFLLLLILLLLAFLAKPLKNNVIKSIGILLIALVLFLVLIPYRYSKVDSIYYSFILDTETKSINKKFPRIFLSIFIHCIISSCLIFFITTYRCLRIYAIIKNSCYSSCLWLSWFSRIFMMFFFSQRFINTNWKTFEKN